MGANIEYHEKEIRALVDNYHDKGMKACRLAEPLLNRRSDMSIYQKANKLGLNVSAEAFAEQMAATAPVSMPKRLETVRRRKAEKAAAENRAKQAGELAGSTWGYA